MPAANHLRSAVFLFAVVLYAQPPKLPEPYQSIIDLAHAAPPEFTADALLRVEESGKIASRDARLALIEEAFRLAAAAQYRISMRALPGYDSDSRTAFLNQAYRLKLDMLSLQSRAVRDMVGVDKPKARELFEQIVTPALPPLTCEDALVPDAGDLYDALALVVSSSFTEKERAKEEHVNLLLAYLAQVTSPVQLAPAARLIKTAGLNSAQREVMIGRFNAILQNMSADDRSYSATIAALNSEITPEMSSAFEMYSRRGLSATRCKDSLAFTAKLADGAEPAKTEGTAKVERYWQSDQAKRIFEQVRKMRGGSDRSTAEWARQLTDFLKDLTDWSASQEKSEADFYHQKCLVYEALIDLTPSGEQRTAILAAFIAFMTGSNLQQQSPVEWVVHARTLYDRMKNSSITDADKLLDAYQASGNPMLALFAAVEKTLGSKLPSWVTTTN